MKNKIIIAMGLSALLTGCTGSGQLADDLTDIYKYGDILNISYTPNDSTYCRGWFVDQGSWIGFTLPDEAGQVNGFCGPFDLANRQWVAPSLFNVDFADKSDSTCQIDSVNYFPGELYMSSTFKTGTIEQRLCYIDNTNILLKCKTLAEAPLHFSGKAYQRLVDVKVSDNTCAFVSVTGDRWALAFPTGTKITVEGDSYEAIVTGEKEFYVAFAYQNNPKGKLIDLELLAELQQQGEKYWEKHSLRWKSYLEKVLRADMPHKYNRIAVKSVMTLLANWKSSMGGLLHEGVVPSHAVGYFMGFWAWDSWKHAVALARFAPELAKNQIRSMFDYQLENGMIIDCIYSDINENNARDSKPPLAAWAVNEVYQITGDKDFVCELYPQLVKYYQWWYKDRDHDKNGVCEFGSVDGTLEAAAWESGMDNAIRFDNAKMVQNADNAWSFDQESVDLNAFLMYEYHLLKQLAKVAGVEFNEPDYTSRVRDYFFNSERGFFFDRHLNGDFILEEGSEAYIPLWSGLATTEQVKKAMTLFTDTAKFSTYIPFPTVAADNPKFMPKGYWRGPIWLDQTYFGISGLRKYGYIAEADAYTEQVFDRLQGLQGDAPIHENYGTHTGECLKAPHFSWSSAHLLMLYWEYGKDVSVWHKNVIPN